MKKRGVKLFLIVIASGVVLAVVATLLWPPRPLPLPTFRFLEGHAPTTHYTKGGSPTASYCFESDFNDVCAEADAELVALGGWECVFDLPRARLYWLRRANSTDSVGIVREVPDDGYVYVVVQRNSRAFSFGRWLRRLLWRVRNREEGARR